MSKTIKKEYRANSKKSLCKSKKDKKCKKIKGCKMTKGPKKTFCRKIRNKKYNKTKKTKGGSMSLGDVANMASKSPLGSQLKAEAEKKFQQEKEKAKQRLMAEGQKILDKKISIDKNTLKIILSKLDEKKIKDLIEGIKNMDEETIKKIQSGDTEVIMKMVKQNPELRALMEVIKDMDADTIKKIQSGDKKVIMEKVMQNSKLRGFIIGRLRKKLTKNPEMQKLALEVMNGSMTGGDDFDRSENSVDALKRVYSNKNSDELNEIMMDPKESMESKRTAQQLIMEKYI